MLTLVPSPRRRRLRRPGVAGGAILGAVTVFALPLALAWACLPGAAIGFDRAVYEYRAGETVTVLGRAFAPGAQVTLTLQAPTGSSAAVGNGVMTNSSGSFQDSFALPASAAPGAYLVMASVNTTDVDGHGRTYEARETFRVRPPSLTTPPAAVQRPSLAPAVGMVLRGTASDDRLVGTQFADMIICGAGDDLVRGAGGNDMINCGAGDDRIDGSAGEDRISGGVGNDRIAGGADDDRISGGAGKDKLAGGAGRDTLKGGSGNDTLRGNAGRDKLFGGPGRDILFRSRGDLMSGGAGIDRIVR